MLNTVAATFRGKTGARVPYKSIEDGTLVVGGLPECCTPNLKRPSCYGKEKLTALLEATITFEGT